MVPDEKTSGKSPRRRRPMSMEAQENELIALAMDQAERQLREGTASSQIIVHYLRLGSTEERVRKRLLEEQTKLASAKTEAYESAKRLESLYSDAIAAMRSYNGHNDESEEDL